MKCQGPHTKVRKGATQFSYGIAAIDPVQRVTPEQGGWWGHAESSSQMLHTVESPEEESPSSDPPGSASESPGCRFQGPTPRDSDPPGLQEGPAI